MRELSCVISSRQKDTRCYIFSYGRFLRHFDGRDEQASDVRHHQISGLTNVQD